MAPRVAGAFFQSQLRGTKAALLALERAERRARKSGQRTVDKSSRQIQLAVRRDVNTVFKGRRVGNAVRRLVYDNGRRGTAAIIFSKFGRRSRGQFFDFLAPYLTPGSVTLQPTEAQHMTVPLTRQARRKGARNMRGLEAIEVDGELYLVKRRGQRLTFHFLLARKIVIRKRIRAGLIARREGKQLAERAGLNFRRG